MATELPTVLTHVLLIRKRPRRENAGAESPKPKTVSKTNARMIPQKSSRESAAAGSRTEIRTVTERRIAMIYAPLIRKKPRRENAGAESLKAKTVSKTNARMTLQKSSREFADAV
jgi:hypothetical protein